VLQIETELLAICGLSEASTAMRISRSTVALGQSGMSQAPCLMLPVRGLKLTHQEHEQTAA